jgi:hypothetical protein
MGRKKLNEEQKKGKLSITINKLIADKLEEFYPNRSKYIENLIYKDFIKNNIIDKMLL